MQYMPCSKSWVTCFTRHVHSNQKLLHALQGMCVATRICYMHYNACSKSWVSGFRWPQKFRGWRLQKRCLAGSPSRYVFLRCRYENGPFGDLNASLYVESRCGSPGDSGLVRKSNIWAKNWETHIETFFYKLGIPTNRCFSTRGLNRLNRNHLTRNRMKRNPTWTALNRTEPLNSCATCIILRFLLFLLLHSLEYFVVFVLLTFINILLCLFHLLCLYNI